MQFNRLFYRLTMLGLSTALIGCGNPVSSNLGIDSDLPNGTSLPTISGPNVLKLTVNGSLCANAYPNKPCVSVTLCSVTEPHQCQTIDDMLPDSGSFGIRVFGDVLNSSLKSSLLQGSNRTGKTLTECVQFGDGSMVWGKVVQANIILGTEVPVLAPIQVIDSTYSNASLYCDGAVQNPSQAGYNGILGIGLLTQDCGQSCATIASNGMYYQCDEVDCKGSTASLWNQVQNPVALLPKDNNGVIIELPRIPPSGQKFADGYLVLGIGTQTNNTPSKVTAYSADSNSGQFTTYFRGKTYSSFLDSGSNGYYFPASSEAQLPDCKLRNENENGWYCPQFFQLFQATNVGSKGTPSVDVTFQIGNFMDLLQTGNRVFFNIGGVIGGVNTFDWGLPFYFGRNVYIGFIGAKSSLGNGPLWAF